MDTYMSGDQKRIQSTAYSDDRESHTTIFMSPESIITGTPIMTDSRGGITMMRSSQTSMDEAIADTTTRHEKLIWYGYKCYERR